MCRSCSRKKYALQLLTTSNQEILAHPKNEAPSWSMFSWLLVAAYTALSPYSFFWYLRKSHSQAGLATCASHFMCLVTLVCFITYQWIHNRRTSVCTVAISLVTATIASQKTLELPLLIYKLFTIIGQLGLSVKVTLLHQNTQSYNMCSILPLQ